MIDQLTNKTKALFQPQKGLLLTLILLDIFFIIRVGKSPAYIPIEELIDGLSVEIFYLTVIIISAGVFLIIPGALIAVMLSAMPYFFFRWLLNKNRTIRISLYLMHRQKISVEVARAANKSLANNELRSRIDKAEESLKNGLFGASISAATLLSTLTMILISNHATPNFLMKVCSLDIPIEICGLYWALIVIIFLQSIFALAISFFVIRSSFFVSTTELPVSRNQIVSAARKTQQEPPLLVATRNWLTGANEEPKESEPKA